MKQIYVYVMDTLADWELGQITAELHSKRFFRKEAPQIQLQTVSCSKDPIITMGGMTVIPDCVIEDMVMEKDCVLLLPGSDTWNASKHFTILQKATEYISLGATVCAICGATVALANVGILNNRLHTSNGVGFLDMFAPTYTGQNYYVDEPAIADNNLITAACTGALPWTKLILERLDVFSPTTLCAWENYFTSGSAEHFYALMASLQD